MVRNEGESEIIKLGKEIETLNKNKIKIQDGFQQIDYINME